MKKKVITTITILAITVNLYAGYYASGRKYFVFKKYEKAKELFLKSAKKYNHGNSYYFLGEIEKIKGNFPEAAEFFRKAITRNTARKYKKNAHWNLIILAEQTGDYTSFIKACKDMWIKLRDRGARHKVESLINKYLWTNNKEAIKKYKEGKSKKEIEDKTKLYNEAISLDSSFLAPKFELGIIAFKNKNYSESSSYINEVVSRIPFYAEAHLILANIYYYQKSYSSAIDHFSKAIEFGFISKKTEYLIKLRRGKSFLKQGEIEKAEIDLKRVVAIKKNSTSALNLLSTTYIKQKKYKKALQILLKLNKYHKNNPLILYKIGSLYYKKNNWKYNSYFQQLFYILKKSDKDISKIYQKALILLSENHFKKGNFNQVIDIIIKINDSSNYKSLRLLAKSYYKIKNYNKSIETYENLSLDNSDRLIIAKAYYLSGRKEKAKESIRYHLSDEEFIKKIKNDSILKKILSLIKIEEEQKEKKQKEFMEENNKNNTGGQQ